MSLYLWMLSLVAASAFKLTTINNIQHRARSGSAIEPVNFGKWKFPVNFGNISLFLLTVHALDIRILILSSW